MGDTMILDEHVADTVTATVGSNNKVSLPNKETLLTDANSAAAFDDMILQGRNSNIRGYTTLANNWHLYKMHHALVEQYWQRMQTNINFINGVRGPRSTSVPSLAKVAHTFYTTLSTPLLRKQCELLNIDYAAYDDVDDIITALVQAHVAMAA